MRSVVAVVATAAIALWVAKASAAQLFDCNSVNLAHHAVCNEQELRDLGNEIDVQVARLLRNADPLTVLLLKRDQGYFADILGADNIPGIQNHNDESYARILAALKARHRALGGLRIGGVTTLEGDWSNAFANVTIAKAETGALTIAIKSRLSYPNENRGEVDCSAMVTAALGDDGWYSAALGDKDFEGRLDIIRFRLQGDTLRIVHQVNSEASVCDGRPHDSNSDRRGGADVLTGSYFPAGPPAKAAGWTARAVAPSFECAKAENADEEELCADPEMAQADRNIARLFGEAMRRIDRRVAGYLRADQRAWASDNSKDFLFNLQPGSDKAQSTVHHTSAAREQLYLRQRQRIILLANLDEERKGIEGVWHGYNASLTLAPAKGKSGGTLHAQGGKWDVEDYKAYCSFNSDGKIQNGIFKAVEEFPKLTRDSGTLVIDAEDAERGDKSNGTEQPSYCSRMRSPKARLFAVKRDSGIEEISELLGR
jgi:uncharacterized protein